WEFLNGNLGTVAVSLVAGGIFSSVGWLIKLKADRRRDRLEFVRSQSDKRQAGYGKMMAAANALHFIKADSYLNGTDDTCDYNNLSIRAGALFEDAVAEVRSNMAETKPFDMVVDYCTWLLLEDHPPMMTPGVAEFDRLRDLLIKCERVTLKNEKATVLKPSHTLDESNEQKSLVEAASQKFIDQDGTMILGLDGNDLANWFQTLPKDRERWRVSRDHSWIQMQRSGLIEDDLPPRP